GMQTVTDGLAVPGVQVVAAAWTGIQRRARTTIEQHIKLAETAHLLCRTEKKRKQERCLMECKPLSISAHSARAQSSVLGGVMFRTIVANGGLPVSAVKWGA